MAFRKCTAFIDAPCRIKEPPNFPCDGQARAPFEEQNMAVDNTLATDVNIDLREVYFLIMHFLSAGPCQRTVEQLWNEVMVHQLLPRRYHAWYSRSSAPSGDNKNDDVSFPLSYNKLVERYPHIGKDHLVKLLKQLLLTASPSLDIMAGQIAPRNVATLFGAGSFSLLDSERNEINKQVNSFPSYLRWPHIQADQVHGLNMRAIGGFRKHHRAPSIRLACHTIIRPSTMVQKMQNIKRLRGHRNAVYCAIIDRSGRYVITGSDDRLVKIWSMESAFCLASCRGHEGDITDLAVSSNNFFVASASNDFSIRVWQMPNGFPISVLRGHSGAVTAIAFSPRTSTSHHLLSSSDDGTCRIWNARSSECLSIYVPKPSSDVSSLGNNNGLRPSNVPSSSHAPLSHQIICCAFNANGSYFVAGSSDTRARVWSTGKSNTDDHEQPKHEIDVLEGHENDVNYVQFSACAVAPRYLSPNSLPEENRQKFKNSWFNHDNIVTCSRDGSAIIWVPVSHKSHGKARKWRKSYHLKVPPPPMAPQPSRGGPRQRRLPTPRGVNMIIWSLDDRFVLAAIMDCRICVWNAKDGTLVHSLTGHSESTYVLDVHPFDPRIAMSAGYDGKTIIWDIWEGKPIRIYEIGRYKLVDGRFSQDGTSIVLSDDAGQIYLLSTGQGESQKDAKYDQFFLGDYRPLTQVPGENVLDQDTGLTPYSRNIHDPLCDSTMMPYPEPYQSMYQRRRLGELGKEWNSGSMKLIMGATNGLSQEMLPLADLDRVAEPLPELIDAMYWEPDVEVINDETDSEYNVTDGYSSEGEIGSVNSSSCSDPECSSEDDAAKRGYEDGLRRSKRGKKKAGVKLIVSSGNRLKRKSLDENGSTSSRTKKAKTRSSSRRTSRTSLKSKSLIPQRKSQTRAASSEDEDEDVDEDDSEIYSSETERSLRDSNRQTKIPVIRLKYLQDESTSLNRPEDVIKTSELPASQSSVGNNKRLLLKIPVGKFTKPVTSPSTRLQISKQADLASSSSSPTQVTTKAKCLISENPGLSTEVTDTELSENNAGIDFRVTKHEVGGRLATTLGYEREEIRWGDVKIRTSKHLKSGALIPKEASQEFSACYDGHGSSTNNHFDELKENQAGRRLKFKIKSNISRNPESSSPREITDRVDVVGGAMLLDKNEDGERPSMLLRCNSDSSKTFGVAGYRGEASKAAWNSHDPPIDFREAETNAMHTSGSVGLNSNYREAGAVSHDYKVTMSKPHAGADRSAEQSLNNRLRQLPSIDIMTGASRYNGDKGAYVDSSESSLPGKTSWLSQSQQEEGYRYIPQLGDEVVYLRQGHQQYLLEQQIGYLEWRRNLEPPWSSIKKTIGAVEFCSVEQLDYTVDQSGDPCCKMKLKFTDPLSDVCGYEFNLTLTDLSNFTDFLVERTHFDAAVAQNWTIGDKCHVWWRDGDGNGGKWWEGHIVSSKDKCSDFPGSPWERYSVEYKDEPGDYKHSPWELHDVESRWEQPHIDDEIRERLIYFFSQLHESVSRNKDPYGISRLNEVARQSDFINSFPAPFSPQLIKLRLKSNYYRSMEALYSDIDVMMSNAKTYFGRNAEVGSKMKRLSELFNTEFSKLQISK